MQAKLSNADNKLAYALAASLFNHAHTLSKYDALTRRRVAFASDNAKLYAECVLLFNEMYYDCYESDLLSDEQTECVMSELRKLCSL